MKYILISASLAFSLNSIAQKKKLFSDTPEKIKNYKALSQQAWNKNDSVKALSYGDSIQNCVINTIIGDYHFQQINGEVLNTKKVTKPIFLLTSASWCKPCMAEIEPLNKIVDEYADRVQFIVLFWDTKEKLEKLSAKYNSKIALIPSNQEKKSTEDNSIDINGFKHVGGYPAAYLIKKKTIIHYSEGAATTSYDKYNAEGKIETVITGTEEQVFNMNYQILKSKIDIIL